jgi:hypothetical protein
MPKATKAKIKDPIRYNDEYDTRSLSEALAHQHEVNGAPLSDRKEACSEFAEALRDPALVAERVGWMIDGNYGRGEMLKAKQIVASPRMNRRAALTHLIGMYEWQCPAEMGVAAWKKLSASEKKNLDAAIDIVIEAAEKEMLEEQG